MRPTDPRAPLAAVVAEGLLGRLAFGMVSFALPLYALSLGLSMVEIGVLVSLRTVVVLPLKPAAGWLADRLGVRPVYLAGAGGRVLAGALLLVAGDFVSLAVVRLLQGASAAGRDVASLGVIARAAERRVAAVYGWYATAKHVGGVAGAGLAGLLIAADGGGYTLTFVAVLILALLPMAAAWYAIHDPPREESPHDEAPPAAAGELVSAARQLAGPATVGFLVAGAAYMLHGLFPVLATEYAGLDAAQAGVIYSLSAVAFLIASPTFGWLIARHGRIVGLAGRSIANVASSLLYLLAPNFAGLALARVVDDSGKAAFRPAWVAAIAEVANADPPRRTRRLAVLDTAENAGQAMGPALAGVLWQTGGVGLLVAGRIALAIAGEAVALRVFGEVSPALHRLRAASGRLGKRHGPHARVAFAFLVPPAAAFGTIIAWLGVASGWGKQPIFVVDLVIVGGVLLIGLLGGALLGGRAMAAAGADRPPRLNDLAHDLRARLTVARGEIEVVLARPDASAAERQRSASAAVGELERVNDLMRERSSRG